MSRRMVVHFLCLRLTLILVTFLCWLVNYNLVDSWDIFEIVHCLSGFYYDSNQIIRSYLPWIPILLIPLNTINSIRCSVVINLVLLLILMVHMLLVVSRKLHLDTEYYVSGDKYFKHEHSLIGFFFQIIFIFKKVTSEMIFRFQITSLL